MVASGATSAVQGIRATASSISFDSTAQSERVKTEALKLTGAPVGDDVGAELQAHELDSRKEHTSVKRCSIELKCCRMQAMCITLTGALVGAAVIGAVKMSWPKVNERSPAASTKYCC
eukprot:16182-Heterococcus_DN1.PRE.2